MEEKLKTIVQLLTARGETIATMESCTGGGVANAITNTEGASEILRFSAVTYSNEYKIKMGVPSDIIDRYTVYSMETAREMAKHIRLFAESTIGIGVTGKINRQDPRNIGGDDSHIFVSIYYRDTYYPLELEAIVGTRKENKDYIISKIADRLLEILK